MWTVVCVSKRGQYKQSDCGKSGPGKMYEVPSMLTGLGVDYNFVATHSLECNWLVRASFI